METVGSSPGDVALGYCIGHGKGSNVVALFITVNTRAMSDMRAQPPKVAERTTTEQSPHGLPGVLHADALYEKHELMARLRMGEWALRMAKRAGLPGHRVGKQVYYVGADVIEWMKTQPKQ